MLKYPFKRIREGKVELLVPDPKAYTRPDGVYEPAWAPIFYNPRMVFNRDITVLFLYTISKHRNIELAVDSLSGSGVRGIRFVVEASSMEAIVNDRDPEACELMEENIRLNNVSEKVKVFCFDANLLHYLLPEIGLRADFIDIDPFGSPIPFIDSAVWATRSNGYIAVTATDTAALTGTYVNACLRKYHSRPLKVDCEKEVGLRILIASVVLRAASRDIAAEPVLAYYADYYYRVFFRITRGARRADKLIENLGYIKYDVETLERTLVKGYPVPRDTDNGSSKNVYIGPLWTGSLGNIELLDEIDKRISELPWLQTANRIRLLIDRLKCEYNVNRVYYRLDKICSKIHKSMPKILELIECLRSRGYSACRSHFDPRGISTDAPLEEIVSCINSLV